MERCIQKSKTVDDSHGQVSSTNYEFVNKNYTNHLNCSICSQLMVNPTRLHPCADTLCFSCAGKSGKCPKCKQKCQARQPDLIALGLINEMTVRCLNPGCPFKGSFEEYNKFHQASCKLKDGLDEWLKSLENVIQMKAPRKNFMSSDEEEKEEQKQILDSKKQEELKKSIKQQENFRQKSESMGSNRRALESISLEESDEFLKKVIRKQYD